MPHLRHNVIHCWENHLWSEFLLKLGSCTIRHGHVTPCEPTAALRPLAFAVWDGDSSWQCWRCQCGNGGVETGCTVSWHLTEQRQDERREAQETIALGLFGRGSFTMWCPVGALCRWTVVFCPLGERIRALRPRKGRNTLSPLKHIPVSWGVRNHVKLLTQGRTWTQLECGIH